MQGYEKIILGSSYFSLGMALGCENSLIIERTQLVDPVFGGTLRGFSAPYSEAWEKETKELYAFFEKNGAIKNERLNILLSEPLLCAFLKPRVLLGTDVIGITENTVTVLNNGGIETVEAKQIIDTRSKVPNAKLNVLCGGKIDKNTLFDCEFDADISKPFEDDETIITFCSKNEMDINLFKMKAVKYLCEKFGEGKNKIIQSAYLMHGDALRISPFDAYNAGLKQTREVNTK